MKKVFTQLEGHKVNLRVAKAEYTKELDLGELAQTTVLEFLRYGAMRWMNDKVAGLDKLEASEKIEALENALLSDEGWVATRATSSAISKEESYKIKLATDKVKGLIQSKGGKLKDLPKGKLKELANSYADKYSDQLDELVKQHFDQLAQLESMTLDLDTLF